MQKYLILAIALAASPAYAIDEAHLQTVAAERVKAIDTSGDGKIDEAEYIANAKKKFGDNDTNKDGFISTDEMFAIKLKEAKDMDGK